MAGPTAEGDRTAVSDEALSLPGLLSPALIAFTIECDNEAEHLLSHRTTESREAPQSAGAPWLISLVLWLNFLRYIPPEGIRVGDVSRRGRISASNLRVCVTHFLRWGYLRLEPPSAIHAGRTGPADGMLHLTPGGRAAETIWSGVPRVVEERWQERFGHEALARLRAALTSLCARLPGELPAGMPIVEYGWFSRVPEVPRLAPPDPDYGDRLLVDLLAKALLGFTVEVEDDTELSLAIGANLLPVLAEGVALKDLPRRTGIAKESTAVAAAFLERHGYAAARPLLGARGKELVLTAKGEQAHRDLQCRVQEVDLSWRSIYGADVIDAVRNALEPWVGPDGSPTAALEAGLRPYPESWRARRDLPERLPRFPVITHRGGYPDGS